MEARTQSSRYVRMISVGKRNPDENLSKVRKEPNEASIVRRAHGRSINLFGQDPGRRKGGEGITHP